MKRIILATLALGIALAGFSQQDSTKKAEADTIKIGGMVIIKKGDRSDSSHRNITISNHKKRKNPNVRTNWWVVDLGFSSFNDQTTYPGAVSSGFLQQGMTEDDFELRTGKSVNVNIWAFQQRLNLIKHVVNLKYGLGVELNNYRFDNEQVMLVERPVAGNPYIIINQEWKGLKKNKLAADYVTVPMMLNFNFTPKRDKGFGFSAGMSAGYLYSARQKIKEDDNKDKFHDNFELRKWKVSYIGELTLGPVKLYGSHAIRSMWEKGLDQTPYNVGVRFSGF
ncbi:MAG TPA: outer membrane beta-barrel protein [Chitinophagaceae bacterium]